MAPQLVDAARFFGADIVASQIDEGLFQRGSSSLRYDALRRIVGDYHALIHDSNLIGDLFNLIHVVRGKEDG